MKAVAFAALCFATGLASPAVAQLDKLESYETNAIGWTKDSDDDGFLDVRLSLKYPLWSAANGGSRLYLAASTRFAQYLGTRESSPVVGKRFNPKLLWRWGTDEYVDFAYAHESNGQSIDSEQAFRANQELARFLRQPVALQDYISRGWDYLELAARRRVPWLGGTRLDFSLKHFLQDGLLQGGVEEVQDWERDGEGKARRHVHGVAALATWERGKLRLAAGYETGYSRPFRHHTVRAEAAARALGLPWMVFYQQGYGSDLALYYKRVSSWGVALELSRF